MLKTGSTKKTYLKEEAEIRGDVRFENMDEGQDLIFVAPEQFMYSVSHKELLLIRFQHGLDDLPEEGQLGKVHHSLQGRGRLTSVPHKKHPLHPCGSIEGAGN